MAMTGSNSPTGELTIAIRWSRGSDARVIAMWEKVMTLLDNVKQACHTNTYPPSTLIDGGVSARPLIAA